MARDVNGVLRIEEVYMATTAYRVSGMTCGHCEHSVRQAVARIEDVERIDVSAADGMLIVTSSAAVDDFAVRAAVEEAGYTVVRSIGTS